MKRAKGLIKRALIQPVSVALFCAWGVIWCSAALAQGRPDFIWKESGPANEDNVNDVAFSPDGRFVASAQADEGLRVIVRRASDGGTVRELGVGVEAYAVAFSPDSAVLATSIGANLTLWRVSDWSQIWTLQGYGGTLAFSPDGALLATRRSGNDVYLLRATDGILLHTLQGHTHGIVDLEFSPDGSLLASGSYDDTAILWRVSDGSLVRRITGHTDYVLSVAFSPDGQTLATGGFDSTIRFWHVEDGAYLRAIRLPHRGGKCLAFSPDGQILQGVAQYYYGIVGFWRVADGALLKYYDEGMGQRPEVAAMSLDGTKFACGGRNGWTGVARHPFPGDRCGSIADASCISRRGVNQLKVALENGVGGDTYTVTLSDGSTKSGTVNSRGTGKAKFANRPDGDMGTVSVAWGCGAAESAEYSCPGTNSDTCEGAIELSLPARRAGSTLDATIDAGFPACGQGTEVIAPGVWYKVVGTGLPIEANTCGGADFNTKINVYEGGCDAPVCVVGNNNICGEQSAVVWDSVAGVPYWILVHGTLNATGDFVLAVTEWDGPIDCARINSLELACDSEHSELTATLTTSLPEGTMIGVSLNEGAAQRVRIGSRGLASVVFTDVVPGQQKVCVVECAEMCESVSCP